MSRYSSDELAAGIHTLIRAESDAMPTDDDQQVAAVVLTRLGVSTRAAQVLQPLVADEVGVCRRNIVRSIEHRSSRRLLAGDVPDVDRVAARASLLTRSFVLPDGQYVTWGDATIEQHRERIAMLDKLRAGISRTISLHEDAVKQCEDAGVSCLNELADDVDLDVEEQVGA